MLSRGSRWFLAFGVLLLAGVAGAVWWLDVEVFDEGVEAGEPVEYTVERGTTVAAVADDLDELGVVRSSFRFRSAAEDAELSADLQPGVFDLETGMSHEDAVAALAEGPVAPPSITFTVPEGLSVEATFEQLAEQFPEHEAADYRAVLDERTEVSQLVVDEDDEAEAALEGVLELPEWVPEPADAPPDTEPYEGLFWPETYDIDDEASPRAVLQRMVDQLRTETAALPEEQFAALDASERYRVLVKASLVERETFVDEERSTVAGVIENRLDDDMQLQIDATVVYALGGGPTEQVTFDDLEVESPYNTYLIDGLPPTPISGVGAAALAAAADPEDVPYRFYVLDAACDGTHRFAESSEEHDANVEEFREADRCIGEELDGEQLEQVDDDEGGGG